MKKAILSTAMVCGFASPLYATGGLLCRTAGPKPIEVVVGFGHVPGSPLISIRMIDAGRQIAVRQAQWWLDNDEVRLLLIAPDASREELKLRARRKGRVYEGSASRDTTRRWIRCRDD